MLLSDRYVPSIYSPTIPKNWHLTFMRVCEVCMIGLLLNFVVAYQKIYFKVIYFIGHNLPHDCQPSWKPNIKRTSIFSKIGYNEHKIMQITPLPAPKKWKEETTNYGLATLESIFKSRSMHKTLPGFKKQKNSKNFKTVITSINKITLTMNE